MFKLFNFTDYLTKYKSALYELSFVMFKFVKITHARPWASEWIGL